MSHVRIHAEAFPLEGPMPGGRAGASVVVEPMIAGVVEQPAEWFEHEPGIGGRLKSIGITSPRSSWWTVPCPSFLIRHPSAGLILVDTGLHPSIATDPKANWGRLASRFGKPKLEIGEDVPARLRALGVGPGQVSIVVMTHLHLDHASCMSEFGDSTFVFSAAEWEAATTDKRPLLRGYIPSHYDHLFDYRTVDFDTPDGEGADINSYGSFGRTFDLLGDGTIRLAYTPGHTAGHMSVILRLPRRDFVIAGDAIYTFRQLEGGPEPAQMVDEHAWRRSRQELQIFHREYPYAIIVPGHDPEFWAKLESRYEE
jgi:N-acyl homoserine lactone hydrolase